MRDREMTRRLKEERELRNYLRDSINDDYPNEFDEIRKEWGRLISALVRAVRQQEREDGKSGNPYSNPWQKACTDAGMNHPPSHWCDCVYCKPIREIKTIRGGKGE